MKREYRIKNGAHIKSEKAQLYGEELARIAKANKNRLEAKMVVEEATKKSSVFHDYFEWDDSVAGKEYRLDQARCLIRSIKIIIKHGDEEIEVKQFINIRVQNGEDEPARKYIPSEIIAKDKVLREQAIKEAMDEFIAIQFKYKGIKELGAIFSAIEETQMKLKETKLLPYSYIKDKPKERNV